MRREASAGTFSTQPREPPGPSPDSRSLVKPAMHSPASQKATLEATFRRLISASSQTYNPPTNQASKHQVNMTRLIGARQRCWLVLGLQSVESALVLFRRSRTTSLLRLASQPITAANCEQSVRSYPRKPKQPEYAIRECPERIATAAFEHIERGRRKRLDERAGHDYARERIWPPQQAG